ncbi:ribbon-helix-helix domain-containing protein [Sessilibacter corallicola]|uniref:Ribbon-helix-helix protein CopG domain-containing protein n=1 Tax=Sessilibacter corallicola TaxID=2904075 RepID=A0ABQ0A6P6_9GAMM
MDKTATQRQHRYREQIAKGEKKRLQVVLDREEADKLDTICATEGISKTEFIKQAIAQHQKHDTRPSINREDKTV